MSETPFSGRRPNAGRNEPQDGDQLPGEHPLGEGDEQQSAPDAPGNPSGHSSRAARGGHMDAEQGSGVPGSATAPSSAGPPDAAGGPGREDDADRG